jgi:hypothetical protein
MYPADLAGLDVPCRSCDRMFPLPGVSPASAARPDPGRLRPRDCQRVLVAGLDIPFGDLVRLLLRVTLAGLVVWLILALPLALLLFVVGGLSR